MTDLASVPWRQGRRKGRNLYAVTGEGWEAHEQIGCLDTPELAAEAVAAHNARLGGTPGGEPPGDLDWLLAAGLPVEVSTGWVRFTAMGDDEVRSWSFEGATIAEAARKAREWAESQGYRHAP